MKGLFLLLQHCPQRFQFLLSPLAGTLLLAFAGQSTHNNRSSAAAAAETFESLPSAVRGVSRSVSVSTVSTAADAVPRDVSVSKVLTAADAVLLCGCGGCGGNKSLGAAAVLLCVLGGANGGEFLPSPFR